MSGINQTGAVSAQKLDVLTQNIENDWTLVDVGSVQEVSESSLALLRLVDDAVIDILEQTYVDVNPNMEELQDNELDDSDWEMDMETEIEGLAGGKVEEEDYEFVSKQDSEGALELI